MPPWFRKNPPFFMSGENSPHDVPPPASAPAMFDQVPVGVDMQGSGMQLSFGTGFLPDPPRPKAKRPRSNQPRQKILPEALNDDGPASNTAYQAAMADATLTISPQELGFLPSSYWVTSDSTFSDLVTKFFQRKNNANCRFPHKLFNALAIVEHRDTMWNLIGARWVTDDVFKIDKYIFGRLLGINSIEGGLFHRQGNFPSHGFIELSMAEVDEMKKQYGGLEDVDMDRVRLLRHPGGLFTKASDEETINKCKWISE